MKTKTIQLKTPITYYGGKQNMLKHILPLVPKHTVYTEAFAGGAALFFAKERAAVEVINDLNGEIINFYRTCVTHFDELKKEIELLLHSRSAHEHAWYIYTTPGYFSNIQRAWALFTLSKLGFAGQLSTSFGFDKSEGRHPKKIFYAKDNFNLSLKERIECTTIESDDALVIIKRYDTKDAFHFIDPPYVGSDMGHYSGMFNDNNLEDLLKVCAGMKGKFLFTMYPNKVIEQYVINNGWKIHQVERTVTACKSAHRRKQIEWMVHNY